MSLLRVRVASTPAYHYLDAQPAFGRLHRYRIDRKSGAVWRFKGRHPHTDHQIWDCVADTSREAQVKAMVQ